MAAFDAPSREACTVRRERTNTPMQALLLMNDIQFIEAARKFAERIMKSPGKTNQDRLTFAFRTATARKPPKFELGLLLELHPSHIADYQKDSKSVLKLLGVGESPFDKSLKPTELAAWTLTANMILNLDETITK